MGLIAAKVSYYVAANRMFCKACYGKCQYIGSGAIGISDYQWCSHSRISCLSRYGRQLLGGTYAVLLHM